MRHLIIVFLAVCLVACEESGTEGLCIAPPCGEIEEGKFNIAILFNREEDYTSVIWKVGGDEYELSLEGESPYSCWNQTILFPSVSLLNVLKVLKDGESEPTEYTIEGAEIETNAISIELFNNSIQYYDWVAECLDTPTQ